MLEFFIFVDTQLDLKNHFSNISNDVNKTIGLFRKLQSILATSFLLITYKSFIRPLLDYGDIIYYQACNASSHQRIKSLLYNAADYGAIIYDQAFNASFHQRIKSLLYNAADYGAIFVYVLRSLFHQSCKLQAKVLFKIGPTFSVKLV